MEKNFAEKSKKLKSIRDKLLKFHKILMDWDRANYEREFGDLTAGKFLEMLLSDERFAWLRTISTLIVRMDEAYDLDDGISNELIEGFMTEIGNMFDEASVEYLNFKEKLKIASPEIPEALRLKNEINELLKYRNKKA